MSASSLTLEAPRSSRKPSEMSAALKSLRSHFVSVGLFSSVINLLYLSSPLYLMQVYNRVLVNENVPTLVLLTIILALALLTMAVLDAVRAHVLIRCGTLLDQKIAPRVFNALIVRSARAGYSRGAQQLREFDHFRTFTTGPGVYFAFDLPWIPIYLLLLFFIHPILGTVATLGAALLFGLALVNEALTRRPLKAAEEAGNQSYGFTDNILRHSDVVVGMGMQPAIERHWSRSRSAMLSEQSYASDRNSTLSSSIRFFRLLLQSLMLGTGAWLAIGHIIMPATIFAASIVMGRALVPVEQGVATWKQFVAAREGYWHVKETLADAPPLNEKTIVPPTEETIAVDGLTFTFPNGRTPVLKDVSFRLGSGEALGIVGPSGSGKSTLARLLIGAITPSSGSVRLGGLEHDQWDCGELGRHVGYLPQDVGLFAGTVRENIARFGDAETGAIVAAARTAGIHDMVLEMPQQYDTPLGPSGVGLSGGQRQRLGLARALLASPALMILDEPNANLDGAGEEALKRALLALKAEGAAIVVITHRPTILDVADRLMFVRSGAIEAIGPPTEVLTYIRDHAAKPSKAVMSGGADGLD